LSAGYLAAFATRLRLAAMIGSIPIWSHNRIRYSKHPRPRRLPPQAPRASGAGSGLR
jgi:hypothetical protein